MNGFGSNCGSRIKRRDLLKGAAIAGATLLVPGVPSLASYAPEGSAGTVSGCLWFEHDKLADTFVPYEYELTSDGTLWMEHDDGCMVAFSREEFSLEAREVGHRLWLWETEQDWYAYRCLTKPEADELLEDMA